MLPTALGDTGVAGSGVVHVPRPPALPPAPGTCASPGGPSARAWPAGGQLWVGIGGHRYGHTWGCTYRACTGMHTRGHMQGHADTGTQTLAHASEHPGCGHRCAQRCMHTDTHGHTGAHLPRLTPCSMPMFAHVCSQGLHVQQAHTGLGKHPPHTMCPCANPTREVTVMPVTLGNANG